MGRGVWGVLEPVPKRQPPSRLRGRFGARGGGRAGAVRGVRRAERRNRTAGPSSRLVPPAERGRVLAARARPPRCTTVETLPSWRLNIRLTQNAVGNG